MSDNKADSRWLRQSQHRNDVVVATVLSMNMKVTLMKTHTCTQVLVKNLKGATGHITFYYI